MYSLILFLPIVVLIVSIVALIRSNQALSQITELKQTMGQAEPAASKSMIPEAAPLQSGNVYEPGTPDISTVEISNIPDSPFIIWLKEDWLLKLGGMLVLIGVLLFLSIAFTQVGPQGKIILGLLLGAGLMAFGFWFAKKYSIGGSAIHVIGAIVIIITTYVAQTPEYLVIGGFLAMLLMFITSSVVMLTAFAYKRQSLAHVGLILASSVPLLIQSSSSSFFDLLLYLCVVIIGVLLLAITTQWRTLVLVSQAVLCMYSLGYAVSSAVLASNDVLMIVVFGFLFFITSVFSILRSQGATASVDGWIALLNAVYAIGWIVAKVPHEWQSMLLAGIAFLYLIAFFAVYKITDEQTSFAIYGGVSLGMLIASVMIQLSGPAETITLLLLTAGATVMAHFLSKKEGVAEITACTNLLPLVGILTSIYNIQQYNDSRIYDLAVQYQGWNDFIVVIGGITVYALVALYFKGKIESLKITAMVTSAFLAVIAVWQLLHILVAASLATFVSLIIYTTVGLLVLSRGVTVKDLATIKLGRIILGLVALRVLFIDAWAMGSTTTGIIICIVIGLVLLSTTLITRKLTVIA